MNWTVELSKPALKQLGKINKTEREYIWRFIKETLPNQHNPRQTGRALQGSLKGLWRYRVGNYRLVCQIKDNEVLILILEIGHRKNIYQ